MNLKWEPLTVEGATHPHRGLPSEVDVLLTGLCGRPVG